MLNKMIQYRYLKHCGAKIDVKVTLQVIDGVEYVHIRDREFTNTHDALKYLQLIAESEMVEEENVI